MSSRSKKLVFILILIIITLGIFVKTKIGQKNYSDDVMQISEQCSGDNRVTCLNNKIISYITGHPDRTGDLFETFWKLAMSGEINDDPRIFSDMVHDVGMILIENNIPLNQALVYCGTEFKYGCIHGAVMEYIDNYYPSKIAESELFELCRNNTQKYDIYVNCLHGVGHELFAKNNAPLQDVLGLCGSLSAQERFACESGVLMEYSKGGTGLGLHSHSLVGGIELPCLELDTKYKAVCYASAGSYRQYYSLQEDFTNSYNYCFSVPNEYIDYCLNGLSERVVIATANNQQKLDEICVKIENNNIRIECIESIRRLTKNNNYIFNLI